MHNLSLDLETFSSVSLPDAGAQKYVESSDFEILLFAYSLDGGPVQVIDLASGEELPEWLHSALTSPDCLKHAYNASFEWLCLNKYLGTVLPPSQWRCTRFHGLYAGFPGSLESTGAAIGLPEDKQKLATGKALIRYFCVPCKPTKANGGRTRNLPKHDPAKWQLFKEYNKQDVVTEMEIEKRLQAILPPDWLQKQWETDLLINYRGVAVDMELVDGALDIISEYQQELLTEAVGITGLDNPNSISQLVPWISETQGDEIPNLTKATVSEWLARDDLEPEVQRILEIRQELGKTSTKKYAAIAEAVCSDSRIHGTLKFYQANRTGRWAGALVQVQNLARTYLEPLDTARQLVKAGNTEALELIWDSVMDTLSQLVRTALVATPGNVLIDADFSAIEARVLAWLAGEEWVLQEFRGEGLIYEATAAMMFGVDKNDVKKGGKLSHLRPKGKVATLACGYGGGVSSLIAMGALESGIPESELPGIVQQWRAANRHITDLWYQVDDAAIKVITEGGTAKVRGMLKFAREYNADIDTTFLTIELPSGRKLYYINPRIGTNRFGGQSIVYTGIAQGTKKWGEIETYGARLVENCLAEGTLVLTSNGWKPIETVTDLDLVWDGLEWCRHDGLISQGAKDVIDVSGVLMTPDHKVLTEKGWVKAGEAEGLNWADISLPDSFVQSRSQHRRRKISLGMPVYLRKDYRSRGPQASKWENKVLRMHDQRVNLEGQYTAWHVSSSGIRGVALHEAAVRGPKPSSLSQLWGQRNRRVRTMAAQLREFLGRHGTNLAEGARPGQNKQRRWIQPGKLQVDNQKSECQESEKQCVAGHTHGPNDGKGFIGANRNRSNNHLLQASERVANRISVHKTEFQKRVYDIRNCGPRHRLAISVKGTPRIVSNCTQAIARDCLAQSIDNLTAAGLMPCFHVHDECIIDTKPWADDKTMLEKVKTIMSQPIPWAPGLPLNADGWVGTYFKKE